MEIKPYNVLKLSLTDISLRRVVVNLWNESDILSSIARIQFQPMLYFETRDAFQEAVEDKVKDKIPKLMLPKLLKEQLMELVRPIGSEIRGWKRYHENYFSDLREEFNVSLLEKLYWTSSGTVDYKKTAEALVRCEMLDIVNRYKLACLYCLEDYIPGFWEKLPEEVKSTFYKKDDDSHVGEPFLHYFWPYILKGEESTLDNIAGRFTYPDFTSIYQYAFDNSADGGNKAAAEYFFHRLTHAEREDSLIQTAEFVINTGSSAMYEISDNFPMEKHSEVLCYLISLMTPEQQMRVFRKTPIFFFICFLNWPFQDLFLEFARLVWTFLPVYEYGLLIYYMHSTFDDLNYVFPKLLQEFFIHSCADFKKKFVYEISQSCSDLNLFLSKLDSKTIKVIFRNLDVYDRIVIISSYKFRVNFYDLIREERWDLIELCLREATFSKGDRERLKQKFLKFLKVVTKEWKRFFQLLEEIDSSSPKKGRSEDETLTKAKKLCCEGE